MKIKTTRFGEISIRKEKIIDMPYGMPGFQFQKKFVIIQHSEKSPFFWYQSIENPALAFVITNPYWFISDYTVDLDDIFNEMSWSPDKDDNRMELYVIVNIPKDSPDKITANLIAPLLINNRTRQAVQMIIADSAYSHKYSLIKKN